MGLLNRGDGAESEVDVDDPENRQYEYKVAKASITKRSTNEQNINELDAKGWEYVDQFMTNGNTHSLLFRREYPREDDSDR